MCFLIETQGILLSKVFRISFIIISLPPCFTSSSVIKNNDDWCNITILWYFDNNIGCFSLYSILDWLILPPTLITLWSSKKGSNLEMLLCLETYFPSASLLVLFWKHLCWYILVIEDSLLCKRLMSTNCPGVLIVFGLIMSRSISLNLNIMAANCFIFDQEDILSNLWRVVCDEVSSVFKECFLLWLTVFFLPLKLWTMNPCGFLSFCICYS